MKLAMMLGEGFEPLEVVAPTDALRRGGVDVTTVSVMPTTTVTAAQDISVIADVQVNDVDLLEFDAICVPGGSVGVDYLNKCEKLAEVLPVFMNDNARTVASICAGPTVLNKLGLLEGRIATCYPGCEVDFPAGTYPGQGVYTDGNLVTASGPGYALAFGIEILKKLMGQNVADDVAQGMLFH